ncbi:MAG: bifunctional (p)ppGpp synthetase/guanosine-3',5'-bis(diphosphate) 3'-pyrophosphohydrolase [Betaproteobacteria bacterium]|nr:bifunctional (p)ppGpp synthetase/guanosine-3',5'-bis(diphosphate) 3'-pyrophosphohydrolase [Betaproteobacteria bacterium]
MNPPASDPASAAGTLPASEPPGLDEAMALLRGLCAAQRNRSGEPAIDHAQGMVAILRELQADEPTVVAAVLAAGGAAISAERVKARFEADVATLVEGMRQVLRLREITRGPQGASQADPERAESLRRMLLAMAVDIRVVILRLASRLQTLRWHAASRQPPTEAVCAETLEVLAPLANRLGLWQLKWELEDLAFRFQSPDIYRDLARQLEAKRHEREAFVADAIGLLRELLAAGGLAAEVSGRPKHLHSIWTKMRGKRLALEQVHDLRGVRVIVADVRDCYAALALIHARFTPVHSEFDDYIARPKPNGYQSLHTVVLADDGRSLEVQIRTREMHRFAEYGVASHWRYKERAAGQGGAARAGSAQDERIAWMRQLLAWQRELGERLGAPPAEGAPPLAGPPGPARAAPERIYVLTPQARVIELPAGSTPVDFAYQLHSTLGHRCRGARVDGQLVPLNTVLANGQTVEILTARPGAGSEGPSRDWLNPQLGYVRSSRARHKVRQWFHALDLERDVANGREKVERVLAREGRTALSFDELAARLGQSDPQTLFVAVAREEIGPRLLEEAVRGPASPPLETDPAAAALAAAAQRARSRPRAGGDGVLVMGVDLLLTQVARCCRPVPPDPICGFVTRGRGVSVHRAGCASFAQMARRAPERVLAVDWGEPARADERRGYEVDLRVVAADRQGLLRDVSEVFARDRLNVTAVRTRSRADTAHMEFTVEVPDAAALNRALASLRAVAGVSEASRRLS